jgi:uncharacterized protein (TIGR02145 family)
MEFPFGTIQEGINAAQNGDVVCVLPGTYSGSGNKNLSPQGKSIVIQSLHGPSTSIIDCEQDGRGFLLNSGESMSTVIRGFSILNGKPLASPYGGSGIFVEDNSGVLITHCIFRSGQSHLGESVPAIQFGDTEVSGPQSGVSQCVFENNLGGGIGASKKSFYCHESIFRNNIQHSLGNGHVANPAQEWRNCIWMNNTNTGSILGLGHGKRVENSLFISNESGSGVVYMGTNWSGMNTVDHCTFWNNTSGYYSSGWYDHRGDVRSSIFADGGDARNHVSGNQSIINYYSSIGPGLSGNNNQSGSVEFVNVDELDFTPTPNSIAIGAGEGGSNAGCDMSLFPEWMLNWIRTSEDAGSSNEEYTVVWNNGQSGLSAWYNSSQTGTVSVSVNGLCEAATSLELGIEGCTDSTAINFNVFANCPNESCIFQGCNDANACNYDVEDLSSVDCIYPLVGDDCEAGAVACAAGTVWDAESQTCVVAIPAYLNEPGETAVLNPCYFDTNYDGLVEVTDLMNLLSVYNMSCFWQCGDRMSYQGYDYETVMIGEQCWFAENLRAEHYTNGQPITEVQASADWEQVSSGARAVVGDNAGISVEEYNANLEAFGRIYNGYATMDARGLCPSGWHLPSDADWIQMEMHLGLDEGSANSNGYRGDEGVLLKSSESDSPSWNGNNESGWSGLPGGNRGGIGNFNQVNNYGYWWTSTVEGELDGMPWVFTRSLATDNDAIYRDSTVLTTGNSVRCVQDE